MTRNSRSRDAARKAAEIFLKRRMYQRQRDGTVMKTSFLKLHYPPYWHYDILIGLKVMSEAGFIRDKRCDDALDLLESKHFKDGGFPAEARYYRLGKTNGPGTSRVGWGVISPNRSNEFVTLDALQILKSAGRL